MSMLNALKFNCLNRYNECTNKEMPRSRKRHHSRSRSKTRSRSVSRDKSVEKQKNLTSHEKDGKRRRLDEVLDSPHQKRSLSSSEDESSNNERIQDAGRSTGTRKLSNKPISAKNRKSSRIANSNNCNKEFADCIVIKSSEDEEEEEEEEEANSESGNKIPSENDIANTDSDSLKMEIIYDKKEQLTTPKKPLTPKQLQKKIESEKKRQQRQKEKEDREKQRNEEKAKLLAEKQKMKEQKEAEKQKILEEKQKQLEIKQKEKELKEEQRRKEKEEKEQKRKEKEEYDLQKRKEKEQERLRKLQEIEEKNKEKQKEEEKKQKTAALFVNFFKKSDGEEKEKKVEKIISNFMPFEVKSDMKLPPLRRKALSPNSKRALECVIENQEENSSYLKDLKRGNIPLGKSSKTWPYIDSEEELTIIEDDKPLGETICENKSIRHKMKAKFLFFHENRRPAYFGTWRKTSSFIKPRRPFEEDTALFNYEEDSDDDWEEEEQGESLDVSGDEDEKDPENDEDDYEVDNDFFVPHGHLSDDEVDDEENVKLSPESLKQKLKLLKDEFDEDMKSKTAKLKPRCIGSVWLDAQGGYKDEAIYKYLEPFAMIVLGPIEIKKRSDIFISPSLKSEKKKVKTSVELPNEHIPFFLKIIHGNVNKKKTVIEEFITFMTNNGCSLDVSKANLIRLLKKSATYKRCKVNGPMKNKFGWFVNDDIIEKYNINVDLSK